MIGTSKAWVGFMVLNPFLFAVFAWNRKQSIIFVALNQRYKLMNYKTISLLAAWLVAWTMTAMAAERWQDPAVNQVNREARRANFFAFENDVLAQRGDKAASMRYLNLAGKWRFHFARNHDQAPKGFFDPKYDDSQWTDFALPGMLELNGYGKPIYRNIGYAWSTRCRPTGTARRSICTWGRRQAT